MDEIFPSSEKHSDSSGGEYLTNERNQLGFGIYEKTDESGTKEAPQSEEEEEIGISRRSKRLKKQ